MVQVALATINKFLVKISHRPQIWGPGRDRRGEVQRHLQILEMSLDPAARNIAAFEHPCAVDLKNP